MRREKRKAIGIGVGVAALVLVAVFCMGRYGWRLFGFEACQGAGIEQVTVEEGQVHISGFYPGSFPSGFCGYYAKEKDGILYVGFRFSPLFGFFENGEIDITVPTKEDIQAVVLKTSENEYILTERQADGSYQRPYHDAEQAAGEEATEGEGEL